MNVCQEHLGIVEGEVSCAYHSAAEPPEESGRRQTTGLPGKRKTGLMGGGFANGLGLSPGLRRFSSSRGQPPFDYRAPGMFDGVALTDSRQVKKVMFACSQAADRRLVITRDQRPIGSAMPIEQRAPWNSPPPQGWTGAN